MILKVTKNQGIYFKDLCYRLLRLFTHKYVNILRNSSYYRVNVKNYYSILLLLFRKTNFQTYFNQVSLRCRHSGVNTPAQTRGKKRGEAQPAAGILKFG
jgi:hypothetical protein